MQYVVFWSHLYQSKIVQRLRLNLTCFQCPLKKFLQMFSLIFPWPLLTLFLSAVVCIFFLFYILWYTADILSWFWFTTNVWHVFCTFTSFSYALHRYCWLPGRCTGPTDSQYPNHRAAGRPPKLSLASLPRLHFPAFLGLELSPEPLQDPPVSYDRQWKPVSLWCPEPSAPEQLVVSQSSHPPSPTSQQTSQAVGIVELQNRFSQGGCYMWHSSSWAKVSHDNIKEVVFQWANVDLYRVGIFLSDWHSWVGYLKKMRTTQVLTATVLVTSIPHTSSNIELSRI